MRSERSPSAGIARRTTLHSDGVVKTFFDGWATMEHGVTAVSRRYTAGRPSLQHLLAPGEGAV